MEALQESTTMLEVACNLLEQGNRKEAQRLQSEARTKRSVSVLLMAKANTLESASRGKMPSH
jgi:BioD-like phosphotransacetylase family protein